MSDGTSNPMPSRAPWRRLGSGSGLDALIAGTVAVVAYFVAVRSLAGSNATPWIEDLLVPCTGTPGWVPDPAALKLLPQWQAFVERRIPLFPCDAIAGMPLLEVGIGWERLAYFHRSLAAWYQVFGPSMDGFSTFQAVQYAAANAVAYLLFRVGLWRIVALGCTAGLMWSKWQLASLHLPIEYAKVPWILATVWLCGLMIRRDGQGRSIWPQALGAGLAAGIGIGFKTDVIAAVPLALATALLFVRRGAAGEYRKTIAIGCVVAGVAIGGGAMIYRNFFGAGGSVLAVQFLGGQDSVTEAMHSSTALYDYGLLFDDSHITALLNSYGRRNLGTPAPAYFFSREMQLISTDMLRTMWATFPGDLVLRVMAATPRVLQLGPLALSVAVLSLAILFVKDLRAGWFVALLTIYLSSYVSLVFQRRHFFHLEFINWWLAGFLVQAAWLLPSMVRGTVLAGGVVVEFRRKLLVAAFSLLAVFAGAAAMLVAARAYQNAAVLSLVDTYLAAPADERTITRIPSDEKTLLRVAGISAAEGDASWPADRMEGDYLIVRFECRTPAPIAVTAKYRPSGENWNRVFAVPCSPGQGTATLLAPIYQYGNLHRFDGFLLNAEDAQLVSQVAHVRPTAAVKVWPWLQVPPDWRSQSWYKTLKLPLETP